MAGAIVLQNKEDISNTTQNKASSLVSLTLGSSNPPEDEWPMFRGPMNHTGVAITTPLFGTGLMWKYTTSGSILSSAAVVDERVYVGCMGTNNKVYCLNAATGERIWDSFTNLLTYSSPAVADGRVYIGSADNNVYCLDATTGTHIWSYATGGQISSSPAVSEGRVYIGSADNKVYCLNGATGEHIWDRSVGGNVRSCPTVLGGNVYVGSDAGLSCLDAFNGIQRWTSTIGEIRATPAVSGGRVYVGGMDKKVYCLNAYTGVFLWSYTTGSYVDSSPAVADGRVYIGSQDNKVYCLDATTGAQLWSYTTGGYVRSSPAVAGGRVYVGSFDKKFYCLDASTGMYVWDYTTLDYIYSSPAISGGRVYVGGIDHNIYCFSMEITPFSSNPSGDEWPMFRGQIDHTGMATTTPLVGMGLTWNYATGDSVSSSPAVSGGRVYVGSFDRKVYCLDAATGVFLWSYTSGGSISSSPAVAGGYMYVGSSDNKVYCLTATTGAFLWSYTTSGAITSSPTVADRRVYVGSDDDKLYCLDATTGARVWEYTTGDWVRSSPAVVGGRVYIGSYDRKVYCLNASTGSFLWSYTTGSWVQSSPAVAGGRVYVGGMDKKVYCLNASTGSFLWSYTTGNLVYSSPAVTGGCVYVGSADYKVYCLNADTGVHVWDYTTGAGVASSPAVMGEYVYISDYNKKLYCLNAMTGVHVWDYTTGGSIGSSPAIAGGRVYLGSDDHKIYCLPAFSGAQLYQNILLGDHSYPSSNLLPTSALLMDEEFCLCITLDPSFSSTITDYLLLHLTYAFYDEFDIIMSDEFSFNDASFHTFSGDVIRIYDLLDVRPINASKLEVMLEDPVSLNVYQTTIQISEIEDPPTFDEAMVLYQNGPITRFLINFTGNFLMFDYLPAAATTVYVKLPGTINGEDTLSYWNFSASNWDFGNNAQLSSAIVQEMTRGFLRISPTGDARLRLDIIRRMLSIDVSILRMENGIPQVFTGVGSSGAIVVSSEYSIDDYFFRICLTDQGNPSPYIFSSTVVEPFLEIYRDIDHYLGTYSEAGNNLYNLPLDDSIYVNMGDLKQAGIQFGDNYYKQDMQLVFWLKYKDPNSGLERPNYLFIDNKFSSYSPFRVKYSIQLGVIYDEALNEGKGTLSLDTISTQVPALVGSGAFSPLQFKLVSKDYMQQDVGVNVEYEFVYGIRDLFKSSMNIPPSASISYLYAAYRQTGLSSFTVATAGEVFTRISSGSSSDFILLLPHTEIGSGSTKQYCEFDFNLNLQDYLSVNSINIDDFIGIEGLFDIAGFFKGTAFDPNDISLQYLNLNGEWSILATGNQLMRSGVPEYGNEIFDHSTNPIILTKQDLGQTLGQLNGSILFRIVMSYDGPAISGNWPIASDSGNPDAVIALYLSQMAFRVITVESGGGYSTDQHINNINILSYTMLNTPYFSCANQSADQYYWRVRSISPIIDTYLSSDDFEVSFFCLDTNNTLHPISTDRFIFDVQRREAIVSDLVVTTHLVGEPGVTTSTVPVDINVAAYDSISGAVAYRALVEFSYLNSSGIETLLGYALVDNTGMARLDCVYIPEVIPTCQLSARVVINTGTAIQDYSRSELAGNDTLFYGDIFARSPMPVTTTVSMRESRTSMVFSTIPEGVVDVVASHEFLINFIVWDTDANVPISGLPLSVSINGVPFPNVISNALQFLELSVPIDYEIVASLLDPTSKIYGSCSDAITIHVYRTTTKFIGSSYPHIPGSTIDLSARVYDEADQEFLEGVKINFYRVIGAVSNRSSWTLLGSTYTVNSVALYNYAIPDFLAGTMVQLLAECDPEGNVSLDASSDDILVEILKINTTLYVVIDGRSNPIDYDVDIHVMDVVDVNIMLLDARASSGIVGEEIMLVVYYKAPFEAQFVHKPEFDSSILSPGTLKLAPTVAGAYRLIFTYDYTRTYGYCSFEYSFNCMLRPVNISCLVSEQIRKVGYNFSITISMKDLKSNNEITNAAVHCMRTAPNGSTYHFFMTISANPLERTFIWHPLKAGIYNFLFSYPGNGTYQPGIYSRDLLISARDLSFDEFYTTATDAVRANRNYNLSFYLCDLDSVNFVPVPGIDVVISVFLTRDRSMPIHTSYIVSGTYGEIVWSWKIPASIINEEINITIQVYGDSITDIDYKSYVINIIAQVAPYQSFIEASFLEGFQHQIQYPTVINTTLYDDNGTVLIGASFHVTITKVDDGSILFSNDITLSSEWIQVSVVFPTAGRYNVSFFYESSSILHSNASYHFLVDVLKRNANITTGLPLNVDRNTALVFPVEIRDMLTGVPLSSRQFGIGFVHPVTGEVNFINNYTTDSNGMAVINYTGITGSLFNELENLTFFFTMADTTDYARCYMEQFCFLSQYKTLIQPHYEPGKENLFVNDLLNVDIALVRAVDFIELSYEEVYCTLYDPNGVIVFQGLLLTSVDAQFSTLMSMKGIYKIVADFIATPDYEGAHLEEYIIVKYFTTAFTQVTFPAGVSLVVNRNYSFTFSLEEVIHDIYIPGAVVSISILDEAMQLVSNFSITTSADGVGIFNWTVSTTLVDALVSISLYYHGTGNNSDAAVQSPQYLVNPEQLKAEWTRYPSTITPGVGNLFAIRLSTADGKSPVPGIQLVHRMDLPNSTSVEYPYSVTDGSGHAEVSIVPALDLFDFDYSEHRIIPYSVQGYIIQTPPTLVLNFSRIATLFSLGANTSAVSSSSRDVTFQVALVDQFGNILLGFPVLVTITGTGFQDDLQMITGVNGTFVYRFPNFPGDFTVQSSFMGTSRYEGSTDSIVITGSRVKANITIDILEALYRNVGIGFIGHCRNLTIPDVFKLLTIVVTIAHPSLRVDGVGVNVLLVHLGGEEEILFSGITNATGQANFSWNRPQPENPFDYFRSVALYATILEGDPTFVPTNSSPIYLTIRKIFSFLVMDCPDQVKVERNFSLAIALYDEFHFEITNGSLHVRIYQFVNRSFEVVDSFDVLSGNSSKNIVLTFLQNATYKITVSFGGNQVYFSNFASKLVISTARTPCLFTITVSPETDLRTGMTVTVTIHLQDGDGVELIGAEIYVSFRRYIYYEFVNMKCVVGVNSSFTWIPSEKGAYEVEAVFTGNSTHNTTQKSKIFLVDAQDFKICDWYMLFIMICFGITISPKITGSRDEKRRKIKLLGACLVAMFIVADCYTLIANNSGLRSRDIIPNIVVSDLAQPDGQIDEETQTTKLIESTYNQLTPMLNPLAASVYSYVGHSLTSIADEMVNGDTKEKGTKVTTPYDEFFFGENSYIEMEKDTTPPAVKIVSPENDTKIRESLYITATATDQQAAVKQVVYSLLKKRDDGLTSLVFVGFLEQSKNLSSEYWIGYEDISFISDGEFILYVNASDNEGNERSQHVDFIIQNRYYTPTEEDKEFEPFFTGDLTGKINLTFTSEESGMYSVQITDNSGEIVCPILSDLINAGEKTEILISIDPSYFMAGNYSIALLIQTSLTNRKWDEKYGLRILRKASNMDLIADGGGGVNSIAYLDHDVHLKTYLSSKTIINDQNMTTIFLPLKAKVVSFYIYYNDQYVFLGSRNTNSEGIADFIFKFSSSLRYNGYVIDRPGRYLFEARYSGNNIYQSMTGMVTVENHGEKSLIVDLDNKYSSGISVAYGDSITLTTDLFSELLPGNAVPLSGTSVDVYIENGLTGEYYLGTNTTCSHGRIELNANINVQPGLYNISFCFSGNLTHSAVKRTYIDALMVAKELTVLDVFCPSEITYNETANISVLLTEDDPQYYHPLALQNVSLYLVNRTGLGQFINVSLGNVLTDAGGRATLEVRVNDSGVAPDIEYFGDFGENHYEIQAVYAGTANYAGSSNLDNSNDKFFILKRVPTSIEVIPTTTQYQAPVTIAGRVQDVGGSPVANLPVMVRIQSAGSTKALRQGITNTSGYFLIEYCIISPPLDAGIYDVSVEIPSNASKTIDASSCTITGALTITKARSHIRLSAPTSIMALSSIPVSILLQDDLGQGILTLDPDFISIEVYNNGGGVNQGLMYDRQSGILTDPDGVWDSVHMAPGNLKAEPVGRYIIHCTWLGNNNFESCETSVEFEVVAIPADLNIVSINSNRFYRNDLLSFTIQADSPAAFNQNIPLQVLVNGTLVISDYKEAGEISKDFDWKVFDYFKAGQFNLTVRIDTTRSSFFGQVTVILDMVSRPVLEISTVRDHNEAFSDRHFVHESETLTVTLRDEDGDVIPNEFRLFNGSLFDFNNVVYAAYRFEDLSFQSWQENTGITNGNLVSTLIPESLGIAVSFQTHAIISNIAGDRFHDPVNDVFLFKVERRPVMLNITNFYHDNPSRPAHLVHRNDLITIQGYAMDLLNASSNSGPAAINNIPLSIHFNDLIYNTSIGSPSWNGNGEYEFSFTLSDLNHPVTLAGIRYLKAMFAGNDVFESTFGIYDTAIQTIEYISVIINSNGGNLWTIGNSIDVNVDIKSESGSSIDNHLVWMQVNQTSESPDKPDNVIFEEWVETGNYEVTVNERGNYRIAVDFNNTWWQIGTTESSMSWEESDSTSLSTEENTENQNYVHSNLYVNSQPVETGDVLVSLSLLTVAIFDYSYGFFSLPEFLMSLLGNLVKKAVSFKPSFAVRLIVFVVFWFFQPVCYLSSLISGIIRMLLSYVMNAFVNWLKSKIRANTSFFSSGSIGGSLTLGSKNDPNQVFANQAGAFMSVTEEKVKGPIEEALHIPKNDVVTKDPETNANLNELKKGSDSSSSISGMKNAFKELSSRIPLLKLLIIFLASVVGAWADDVAQNRPGSTVEVIFIRIFNSALNAAYLSLVFFEELLKKINVEVAKAALTSILSALMIGMIVGSVIAEVLYILLEFALGAIPDLIPWWLEIILRILIEVTRWTLTLIITAYLIGNPAKIASDMAIDTIKNLVLDMIKDQILNCIIGAIINALLVVAESLISSILPQIFPQSFSWGNNKWICQETYGARPAPRDGSDVRYHQLTLVNLTLCLPFILGSYFMSSGIWANLGLSQIDVQNAATQAETLVVQNGYKFSEYYTVFAAMLQLICEGYEILYASLPITITRIGSGQIDVLRNLASEPGPDIVATRLLDDGSEEIAIVECKGTLSEFRLGRLYVRLPGSGFNTPVWQPTIKWLFGNNQNPPQPNYPSMDTRYLNKFLNSYERAFIAIYKIISGHPYTSIIVVGNPLKRCQFPETGTKFGLPITRAQLIGNAMVSPGSGVAFYLFYG